ncbi:hypothetical protein HELRODRAFT_183346 [Helobdella robusta]|uniref:Uncharacterized protein n=1 Tax=Helobdella robusta TaxID=6412 RepID=T1FJH5_HELRO|nr:hypothetical protein HELRODRAFT_183346 [Helobdella robusta]ESO11241.1 hypothetical protein HELRODRAFT_183346 [Helobdella robusta]
MRIIVSRDIESCFWPMKEFEISVNFSCQFNRLHSLDDYAFVYGDADAFRLGYFSAKNISNCMPIYETFNAAWRVMSQEDANYVFKYEDYRTAFFQDPKNERFRFKFYTAFHSSRCLEKYPHS